MPRAPIERRQITITLKLQCSACYIRLFNVHEYISTVAGARTKVYKCNFSPSFRQRPYHVENTGSRPITEVKQRRARLVLGWVTAWESRVLQAFYLLQHCMNIRACGATVARLTPDQKVACSNHVGLTLLSIFQVQNWHGEYFALWMAYRCSKDAYHTPTQRGVLSSAYLSSLSRERLFLAKNK